MAPYGATAGAHRFTMKWCHSHSEHGGWRRDCSFEQCRDDLDGKYCPEGGEPELVSAESREASGNGYDQICYAGDKLMNAKALRVVQASLQNDQCATDGVSPWEQLLVGKDTPKHTKTKGYCENVKHLNDVVGNNGETCYSHLMAKVSEAAAKANAQIYCPENPQDIKTATCSIENIGSEIYQRVAAAYCDDADLGGPKDPWCACYNAFSGKCNQKDAGANFAGCTDVNQKHQQLVDDIPTDQQTGTVLQQLEERKHCRANVCKDASIFRPSGSDVCDLKLQVCIQDAKVAGHLVESGVTLECNQTMNEGGGGNGGDSGKGGGGGGGGSGGGSGGNGGGDGKEDGNKLLLLGGAQVVSFICLLIVVIAMSI